ncbi:hypothetical protein DFH06DRAFT_1348250 [Mycena polygramma]|nr:hypothetical protein DFH06DRAFT_1348250 [Mycena polygramma]
MLSFLVTTLLAFATGVVAYPSSGPGPALDARERTLSSSTTQQFSRTLSARATRNVCGEKCTVVSCIGGGTPASGTDCAIIADAIDILSAELGAYTALRQ